MYPVNLKFRKTRKLAGCFSWILKDITIYLPRLWRAMMRYTWPKTSRKAYVKYHIEKLRYSDKQATLFADKLEQLMFIKMFSSVIFHEFMHGFMKENNLHPYTCFGCQRGKCKLCNMTDKMSIWVLED